MTTSATSFGYGARVFQPIERNPNEGGGPIRRSPLVAAPANAGTFVQRSPHKMIPDPGRQDEPQLLTEKFLPDGRLVADHAFGAAVPPMRIAIYTGAFALAGTIAGALLHPDARGRGAVAGGVIGLGSALFGVIGGTAR